MERLMFIMNFVFIIEYFKTIYLYYFQKPKEIYHDVKTIYTQIFDDFSIYNIYINGHKYKYVSYQEDEHPPLLSRVKPPWITSAYIIDKFGDAKDIDITEDLIELSGPFGNFFTYELYTEAITKLHNITDDENKLLIINDTYKIDLKDKTEFGHSILVNDYHIKIT